MKISGQEIAYAGVRELQALYRDGSCSPVDVAQIVLERLERLQPKINAFSQRDAGRVLAAAEASRDRWRKGRPVGPLDGIPFSAKDTLTVKGYAFKRGSRVTPDTPATESAPAVDRVLESGAILLGITTTPEFGGGPVTISPLTGITRNPWDTSRSAGGSSGGAAASIAAGIGAFALATDAGGSIRIPSSFCGVVGFKPTGGVVPAYPPSVAGALSSPGAIARSVADCALVTALITAPDARDPETAPWRADLADDLDDGIAGLRILASETLGYARFVDEEVREQFRRACGLARKLGAQADAVEPALEDPLDVQKTLFMAGFAFSLRKLDARQHDLLGDQLRDIVNLGRDVTLERYLEAQTRRREFAARVQAAMAGYDVLITPAVAVPPFEAERWQPSNLEHLREPRAWVPFSYPFNLTQQPALSLPCGFTRAGLPVGLQIVGRRHADKAVLRVAKALEAAGLCPARRPEF